MENKNSSPSGIGFIGLLLVALITLYLIDSINWGLIWASSPFLIPFIFVLIIIVVAVIRS